MNLLSKLKATDRESTEIFASRTKPVAVCSVSFVLSLLVMTDTTIKSMRMHHQFSGIVIGGWGIVSVGNWQ